MAKYVVVTHAQKSAARAMVERSAVTGRYVSPSVRKIADAKSSSAARRNGERDQRSDA